MTVLGKRATDSVILVLITQVTKNLFAFEVIFVILEWGMFAFNGL